MSAPSRGGLFLIRHGVTAANAVRYVGWEDEPLSDAGRAQAMAVSSILSGARIDAVYASPLSRAKDTAMPLARARGLAVIEHVGLKEINYGDYQGRSKDVHPLKIRKSQTFEPMPGGESLRDVQVRLSPWIEQLTHHVREGQTIAAVAHFWTNRILLGSLLGLPLEGMFETLGYKPRNASVLDVDLALVGDRLDVKAMRLLTPDEREDDA